MRVLLVAHPTVGHTQALRAIGRALLAGNHEVHFALPQVKALPAFLPVPAPLRSGADVWASILRDGFAPVPLPLGLSSGWAAFQISRSRGYDELDWAMKLFTGEALPTAKVLGAQLRRARPQVVLADCFHYGAWLAAEAAQVPFVSVFHSGLPFPAPGAPPFGTGLGDEADPSAETRLEGLVARVDAGVAAARLALSLPPVAPRLLTRPYARALNVLTTFEQFELPRPQLAQSADGPLLWAGPCLGSTRPEVSFPWERLEGSKPWVYLSLGTVFNAHAEVYRVLLAGVHQAGARAVVAAGVSFGAVQRVARPDDVVVTFAPQVELLPRMQAAIVHGGNNSTNEVLKAGVPFVSVPFGGEQISNARRAVSLGVARALKVDSLSPGAVAEALRAVLTTEAAERSKALAAKAPREDGVPKVLAALERFA